MPLRFRCRLPQGMHVYLPRDRLSPNATAVFRKRYTPVSSWCALRFCTLALVRCTGTLPGSVRSSSHVVLPEFQIPIPFEYIPHNGDLVTIDSTAGHADRYEWAPMNAGPCSDDRRCIPRSQRHLWMLSRQLSPGRLLTTVRSYLWDMLIACLGGGQDGFDRDVRLSHR